MDGALTLYGASNPQDAASGPTSGRRATSKAANRSAILAAARQVFAELGYEQATVRDIIRGTDLASGTFYNYFKSKEEIADALQRESASRFAPLLKAQVNRSSASFEETVQGALKVFFTFLATEHEARGNGPDFTLMVEPRQDTPENQAVFHEVHQLMENIIARGDAPAIDVDYATAAAIGVAREIGRQMLLRTPFDVEGATHFATQVILGGLRKAGDVS
jgi:AcrR family transcriptional regulator